VTADNEVEGAPKAERAFPVAPRRAMLALASAVGLLLLLYWMFVRVDYVDVFQDLREADAAAVVATLNERDIPHRLANGGRTISVRSDLADQARLDIASSEVPLRGQIGFELFNESDMGLTEFAQKINYLRALQGELARTIMLLDGIESARVHIAMPDRALFRAPRTVPTAAVTLLLQRGRSLAANNVVGIQRLVAASVPDLTVDQVAIVDRSGRLMSAAVQDGGAGADSSSETAAVANYYRARIGSAIAAVDPTLAHQVKVQVRPREEMRLPLDDERQQQRDNGETLATTPQSDLGLPVAAGRAIGRNYALDVEVRTAMALDQALRARLAEAVSASAELGEGRGDRLVFAVGAVRPTSLAVLGGSSADTSSPLSMPSDAGPHATPGNQIWASTLALIAALMVGICSTWLVMRRGSSEAQDGQRNASFAAQLRQALSVASEPAHGVG
jgi:flagellar M-ring protein FliF